VGSIPTFGIMNRERYIELDRSGTGLTKEEWEQGWHWCGEWDDMLVGPNTDEALVCSCGHPAIERWKESEEGKKMQKELDEAKDKPLALTPQPICTAPRDGTPILVWDCEWNAWVAARWLVVCEINKGLDSGGWYGDHDCSWKGNCLDARTPQWWLPMPPEPTKILNGIVVNRGKEVPPKFELGEDDE
jgi:hypothetical protein